MLTSQVSAGEGNSLALVVFSNPSLLMYELQEF